MTLFEISVLAKKSPLLAEPKIKSFIEETFHVEVAWLKINISAVSLNSVNGFLGLISGEEFFFKFHAEEGEKETVSEYYRAEFLESSGFPVIMPLYKSTKAGEQFLMYPRINAPTFFEVCDREDRRFLETGAYDETQYESIINAEREACEKTRKIFEQSLHIASSETVTQESIWQLFSTRLCGDQSRLSLFYLQKHLSLPDNTTILFDELAEYTWEINGTQYPENLQTLIESAQKIVHPKWQKEWACVTAHGDDHNGNKFFFPNDDPALVFFDPAFAGEHIPAILAFIKTTFHDVFAHPLWFYSPADREEKIHFSWEMNVQEKKIKITHDISFDRAPIRKALLDIKREFLWKPLVSLLRSKNMLPKNTETFLRLALFCCPFLAVNLINTQIYSPKMSLLGLSKAVEMGHISPYILGME